MQFYFSSTFGYKVLFYSMVKKYKNGENKLKILDIQYHT